MIPTTMQEKIWLSSPHMGTQEFEFVKEAFNTNWIAPQGPLVDGFEKDLAAYTGAGHVAALSSGTAALHLALVLLGVERGDEVICQSMTFSASANPIVYQGATPVFVDSEPDTWNMDPRLLQAAIENRLAKGKKIKAVIPVHLYGMPANMDAILEVAAQYAIPVVEDAAEALGATYYGKACGTMGTMGILSFNGNKIITTSGGGALMSNSQALVQEARFLATQARDPAPHYQHTQIGFNYRMSNVCAGIGRGQMQVLPCRIAQRRAAFEYYRQALAHLPGISFTQEPAGSFSNRWLTTILINPAESGGITREQVRLALEKENIDSRPLWKPMHLQPVFAACPAFVNNVSELLFSQGLCLPSGSNLVQEQLQRIVKLIRALWS
ncbi:MAG TPA: aminotransferase class I/II-fold pyridoxal phosphate-dependent enzyme [Chitinophaga sp.]|uniref:DegT/DnrJ/EryC1/StrS family aminotransferase n=1 Tax=Chitinophaga sp. TaxID=1869181 RepID=UPI002DB6449A|nr:aminotransferase class I/II-fold pyridoxal phosphate-dependent enzyme [Chitinophaga sp.]HEU4554737.1 aminotransferase class I/II-fold pyridoxal phosphate-dependent enzyme [Chitinophaga sp.]